MENEIYYEINNNIGIEIPKGETLITFRNYFNFLRKSLYIEYIRRTHIDGILRRVKAKFFKAIYNCLQQCVTIKIKKLPKTFLNNNSIDYNKKFLGFTIKAIFTNLFPNLFQYFSLLPYPIEIILQKNYCIKGKESCFKYIFLSKIDFLYSIYIQCVRYKKEIELMKKKKGIKMTFLYQFVSENILYYYHYSNPHLKMHKSIETINNNNENNNEVKKK